MLPIVEVWGNPYPSFSLMLLIYVMSAMVIVSRQCYIKYDIRYRNASRCVMTCVPFVAVGGKLMFMLTVNVDYSLLEYLLLGGFVFYGGLIGFCVGVLVYTKYTGHSFMKYMNFWSPYIAFGQAVGRIGCLLNGCCYGKTTASAIAIKYPMTHITHGVPVLPVPIMESAACLLLAVVLFRRRQDGKWSNFVIYLASYAAIRFIIEFFRGDEIRGIHWLFSTSQWISLCILISLAVIFFRGNG